MVTRLEYAMLSWAAYKGNKIPDKNVWGKIDEYNNSTGFAGSAFINKETGEIVIAFRGTDDLLDWINGNLVIGTPQTGHELPLQYNAALNFYNSIRNKYPDLSISITGHSLGGMLAQLVGATTLAQTVTFNSIGVEHLLDDLDPPLSKSMNYSNIKNYSLENDALYNWHLTANYQFLGESYVIPSTNQSPVDAHNNIAAVGYNTAYPVNEWSNMDNATKERLRDTFTEAQSAEVPRDPLLIDLDGDGIETTTVENGVYFDHESDGFEELSMLIEKKAA